MDEMMNMNETTMENETSVEVVPEENVQMIDNEETSSNGSGIGLAVGMSILHRWTFLTRTLRKLLKRSNVR